jgi:hypothetical protein
MKRAIAIVPPYRVARLCGLWSLDRKGLRFIYIEP